MLKHLIFSQNKVVKGNSLPTGKGTHFIFASAITPNETKALVKKYNLDLDILKEFTKYTYSRRVSIDPFQMVYVDEYFKDNKVVRVNNLLIVKQNIFFLISEKNCYDPFFNLIFIELKNEKKKRRIHYILYHFLEYSIEENYTILKNIDKKISNIHEDLINQKIISPKELLRLKRELFSINNTIWKFTQLIFTLKTEVGGTRADKEDRFILDDIYHSLQHQIEIIMSLREMLTDLLSLHLSNISNSLNKVMKTLTAITVIIAVPALLASIFDTSFVYIPLINLSYGFFIFVAAIATFIGFMYIFFKRKQWL